VHDKNKNLTQADYLRLLDDKVPYTMHFVDDMVVVREWGLPQQLHAHHILQTRPEVVAHSLRSEFPVHHGHIVSHRSTLPYSSFEP
jgi:hypothetical protein